MDAVRIGIWAWWLAVAALAIRGLVALAQTDGVGPAVGAPLAVALLLGAVWIFTD